LELVGGTSEGFAVKDAVEAGPTLGAVAAISGLLLDVSVEGVEEVISLDR
jgi:hypothetical protein